MLREAKSFGFRTYLYYVATEDPEINISRVALRVAQGGHDVPKAKIISRYHRSLGLVRDAIRHTDRAYFFDTSETVSLYSSGRVRTASVQCCNPAKCQTGSRHLFGIGSNRLKLLPANRIYYAHRLIQQRILAAGNCAHDEKWLRPGRDSVGQRTVRRFVRHILFACEEPQKRPATLRHVVADGPAKHRIASLEHIEHQALRDLALDFELTLGADWASVCR